MKISTLSDCDLLTLYEKYGTQAKFWYRKFLGLLPEINRRRIYEKRKCSSICEFAGKFGGVTKEQTERVICIERTLLENGMEQLREMLTAGEISMHKLTRVMSVVNKENEKILVHAVKNLPQDSLETYVRDLKNHVRNETGENVRSHTFAPDKPQGQANLIFENSEYEEGNEKNGNLSAAKNDENVRQEEVQNDTPNIKQLFDLGLHSEVVQRLNGLKAKGFDINAMLTGLLDGREETIAQEKQEVAQEQEQKERGKSEKGEEISRHIPRKVEKILQKEFGKKCAVRGCGKNAEHIHHTARFELTHSHNPYFMAPFCKRHHDIAHLMDERFLEMKTAN